MYEVVSLFTDLQDGGYEYRAGDKFPREGLTVTAERIAELSGCSNRQGKPLIKKVARKNAKRSV